MAAHAPKSTRRKPPEPAQVRIDRVGSEGDGIAKLPPLTASYTRVALTQKLRRLVDESVGYGLALEGISAADVARSQTGPLAG